MPCHAMPMPCLGLPLSCDAMPAPCLASLSMAMLCRCRTFPCFPMPSHCAALQLNADALRSQTMPGLCYAVPCPARALRRIVTPRCAGAAQWIPLRNFACAIRADPYRSAALLGAAGPCPARADPRHAERGGAVPVRCIRVPCIAAAPNFAVLPVPPDGLQDFAGQSHRADWISIP